MIPDYWLERPAFELTQEQQIKLETLWHNTLKNPDAPWIENLPVPKWVFLCWLVEAKEVLLHGSGKFNIQTFEPQTPNAKDDDEFSQQTAVFASSDGIYPMIFAILNRQDYSLLLLSSALRFELPLEAGGANLSDVRYFFSVTDSVLLQRPWREGAVYVLPKDDFALQAPYQVGNSTVYDPHWANLEPVQPLAKLKVSPEDFPFLNQVRGHDNDVVQTRVKADPRAFPWLVG